MTKRLARIGPNLLARLVKDKQHFVIQVGSREFVPDYGRKLDKPGKLKNGDLVGYNGNFAGRCDIGYILSGVSHDLVQIRAIPRSSNVGVDDKTHCTVHMQDILCRFDVRIEELTQLYRLGMTKTVRLGRRDITIAIDADLKKLAEMQRDMESLADNEEGMSYFIEEV